MRLSFSSFIADGNLCHSGREFAVFLAYWLAIRSDDYVKGRKAKATHFVRF